jgi:hypothetical protein
MTLFMMLADCEIFPIEAGYLFIALHRQSRLLETKKNKLFRKDSLQMGFFCLHRNERVEMQSTAESCRVREKIFLRMFCVSFATRSGGVLCL